MSDGPPRGPLIPPVYFLATLEVIALLHRYLPLSRWLIEWRFIRAEEAMLAASFGESYASYGARVRRWL